MLVYIGFGGNLGDVKTRITHALDMIADLPTTHIVEVSNLYQTPPWGGVATESFLNGVVAIETELEAHDLLQQLLQIEHQLGRVRVENWGNRTIDLDILTYGDEVYNDETLQVPHPYMLDRAFVLIPLCEITDNQMYVDALARLPIHEYTDIEQIDFSY
ncbi:MAG: 2-amino-4-hydroxy-6-hydroxymethyldihydropteridine diphosphokinase [Culicoidibacterales bacterium]